MSFKRDGDDKHALDNLRQRRVSDLLYEDIQEGEVSRLRNGRYLCKVCGHCPTFDTLNMFQVHKQGRKHQTSLEYKEVERQDLQDLIQKRQQQLEADDHIPTPTQVVGQSVAQPSTKPTPYDPRSRSHRAKPYDRKATIDLNDLAKTCSNTSTHTTSLEMLPGKNKSGNDISHSNKHLNQDFTVHQSDMGSRRLAEQDKAVKQTKSYNTKSIGKSDHIPRNMKQNFKGHIKDEETMRTTNIPQLVGLGKGEVSKHYFARKQKIQTSKDTVEPLLKPKTVQDFSKSWDYFKDNPISKAGIPVKKVLEKKESVPGTLHKVSAVQQGASCHKDQLESVGAGSQHQAEVVQLGTNKERAAKMLNAFGSGWKRDWMGNWVKDEDAEFDSDEESPHVS